MNRHADGLEMREQRLRVEEHAAVTAPVRRRARAVDDDVPAPTPVARVIAVLGVVDALDLQAPPSSSAIRRVDHSGCSSRMPIFTIAPFLIGFR